ncbi:MAG: LptF/LptG family permease [Luteolibacter sp.]
MLFSRETLKRLLVPLLLALLGVGLFKWLVPGESRAVYEQLAGFPDSDAGAHAVRPTILGALCFLPALCGLAYAMAGTLARYMARQFFGILAICFCALLTIWLLQDLQNNLPDLRGGKHLMHTIIVFYGTRLPFIVRELLPYSLLLSLLFCLGKLSKSREIVAMIQTGRSLPRIVSPLILSGLMATALCMALNYHWAPVAEGSGEELLQQAKGAVVSEASNVLYRNSAKHRLWMVGTFPKNYEKGAALLNVEVTVTDDAKNLVNRITADRAIWNPRDRSWTFENAWEGDFKTVKSEFEGEPDRIEPIFNDNEGQTRTVVRRGWSETPWQLIKPGLAPPYLGIPDLNSWLRANAGNELTMNPAPYLTQWHYRWAQPVICLVTVLLAAPLGIHFSRRGSTGGVAMAVALSGALLFLTTTSLSFGEATIIPPAVAAWTPNVVFALLGIYLFHRRITGRPIYQSILKLFPGNN